MFLHFCALHCPPTVQQYYLDPVFLLYVLGSYKMGSQTLAQGRIRKKKRHKNLYKQSPEEVILCENITQILGWKYAIGSSLCYSLLHCCQSNLNYHLTALLQKQQMPPGGASWFQQQQDKHLKSSLFTSFLKLL